MSTPRTDSAYLSADGDNHERVSAMLAASEKLEREHSELLDALIEVSRLPVASSYPDGPCIDSVDMDMVKAAIAKATGKETE